MVAISLPSSIITLFESHNAVDNLWGSKLSVASPEGHATLDSKAPCHRLVAFIEQLNDVPPISADINLVNISFYL
jgi:hypothetical protein